MPFYDFNNEDEEITLEKLLENQKFLDYITTKKMREDFMPSYLEERKSYRKAIKILKRLIKRKNEKLNG